MSSLSEKISKNRFLFEELVKRDFKKKYKRTALGMLWSVLSPLLSLIVMKLIFTNFFGRHTPHYTIYLFAGNIIMSYFREATKGGMSSLMSNASILTKINVPKILFLLSKNVSAFFNFMLTLALFFIFCIFDHISFGPHMFMIAIPVICLILINVGIGMILSALYVFFRDIQYLYEIFLVLLNYVSAIFYTVDNFPEHVRRYFLLNPVYVVIKYIRMVVIDQQIPSPMYHLLIAGYTGVILLIGVLVYKKNNNSFIYYL